MPCFRTSLMSILFVAALVMMPVTAPHAALFAVDSAADDGTNGTLRWAIEQHNADPSVPNTIDFTSAVAGQTITLDIAGQGDLPTVTDGELLIFGDDAIIDADGGPRILTFSGSSVASIEIRDLTLTGASGPDGGSCFRSDDNDAEITLRRMRFENCESFSPAGGDALGGAVHVDFLSDTGRVLISNSQFRGNRAFGSEGSLFGGAVYIRDGQNNRIEDSLFELNVVEEIGGGFSAGGAVYLRNNRASLFMNEFLFNQAPTGAGGALVVNASPSDSNTVLSNTFAANVAEIGAAFWHGTQSLSGAPFLQFVNNTLSSNSSTSSVGGAVFFREGEAEIRSNTFEGNLGPGAGAAHIGFNPNSTTFLDFWNNLLAASISAACASTSGAVTVQAAGYNVLPDSTCGIGGIDDQIVETTAFLALGDYGGIVLTAPPLIANPGIDAANPDAPDVNIDSRCWTFDTRSQPRPADGDADGTARCTAGAFEWQQEAPIFLDGLEAGLVIP